MPDDSESLANLAHGIREQTGGTPEREAKLQELAARIRSGAYEVDPERLAETLLRETGSDITPSDSEVER